MLARDLEFHPCHPDSLQDRENISSMLNTFETIPRSALRREQISEAFAYCERVSIEDT